MIERKDGREVAIHLSGVKKMYKLGQIGGGTLQGDLQSWWARVRGKEDPNSIIGQEQRLVGKSFLALNGINLTVYKGEALGIIGSNGAGKSTLLKLLSRVTAPTEGEIDIYGRVASMLEVGTGFNGEMTGRENIYMNGTILGMTRSEIDAKMEDIIDFSEVREFIDTPVKRYSSGMYVKLAFSVAAHLDSEIMIMDEVLAVGDMAFQKKCLDRMKDASGLEDRTVLYVSHNMNTIRQLCERCIVLENGKVVFDGNVENAIGMYMNSLGKVQSNYTYSKEYHTNHRSNNSFIINSLSLKDHKESSYDCGDRIKCSLICYSLIKIRQVYFRFEIKYQDGSIAGTMFSDLGIDYDADQNKEITLELNTIHMVPGQYYIDIIAFQYNEFGQELFIDGVYPGLVIEISDLISKNNKLVWSHRYWGHVKLHDVHVIDQE